MTAPRLLVLADDLIWSTRLEGQGRTLGADVQRFATTEPLIAALTAHPATPSDLVLVSKADVLVKNGSGTLFLRGLPRTVADFLWLVRIDGSKAIEDYARALHDGLRQRAAVSLRARVLRRDIERRWVVRSGRA